jgi:hypothetical protein
MRFTFSTAATISCLLAALVAGAAHAQVNQPPAAPPRPTIEDMTIINGSNVTHSYSVQNGSPQLEARYKELELADNEMNLAFELSHLKQDYVQNERTMDNLRVVHYQMGWPDSSSDSGYSSSSSSQNTPTIKSEIAPQLAQSAIYENGVKAIRTWERAKVDALNASKAEGAVIEKPALKEVKPQRPAPIPQAQADPTPDDAPRPAFAASPQRGARGDKPAPLDLGVFEPLINMPFMARQATTGSQPQGLNSQASLFSNLAIVVTVTCIGLGVAIINRKI